MSNCKSIVSFLFLGSSFYCRIFGSLGKYDDKLVLLSMFWGEGAYLCFIGSLKLGQYIAFLFFITDFIIACELPLAKSDSDL